MKSHTRKLQEQGYAIFPVAPNQKYPMTSNGFKDASNDQQTIERWWSACPEANIGLVTGPESGLLVIDVDVKPNADGLASLQELEEQFGELTTRKVVTPSGGYHLYFKHPGVPIKNHVGIKPGIDLRSGGGYVLAPGSSIDGNAYYVENDIDPQDMPCELVEYLHRYVPASMQKASNDDNFTIKPEFGITEGSRNHALFMKASSLRGTGISQDAAEDIILHMASGCTPPLPTKEAMQIVQGVYNRYPAGNSYTSSDLGNAKRLVSSHMGNIRYLYDAKKWIYWDGTRWVFDEDGHLMRLAKQTAMNINREAADTFDDARRSEVQKHAKSSESLRSLNAMCDLAKTEEGIPYSAINLDKADMYLGANNGVINLESGELVQGDTKHYYITKKATVTYDPEAKCPTWLAFLDQALDGDEEFIRFMQKAVGYSLTGDTSEQVLFFLYGVGANGKSTFVNTLQTLLGDYAQQAQVSTFMTKHKGSINNDIARLRGSRFVATTETEEGSRFNESELKQLTGGDTVTARFLHQEHFEFVPNFKLWISGNHKPYIQGNDIGIWRRIRLVPFVVTVPPEKQDKELSQKLIGESAGILNWALEGCKLWLDEGLGTCKVVDDATKEYRHDMDVIARWIDEWCTEDANATVQSNELYNSFKSWAMENGEYTPNTRKFKQKLLERGILHKRTSSGSVYLGLKLGKQTASHDF